MITLTPVLERWSADCPFWHVDETDFFFAVPRQPTPRQVETVIWTLIGASVTADDLSLTATNAIDAIETYLAWDDGDYAPGGLRVAAGDVVIDPGCCIGLDEWRDWLRVLDGETIDLGHDPDVYIEHRAAVLRVWKDRGLPGSEDYEKHVDVPRDALPQLLRTVRQDLVGFLTAVGPWTRAVATDLADPLTAALDRRLRISATLDI